MSKNGYGWKITRDVLAELEGVESKEVGRGTMHTVGELKYKFRLYDDDGVLYYEGVSASNDDAEAFEPLDYYEGHSGCTRIDYLNEETGEWETL